MARIGIVPPNTKTRNVRIGDKYRVGYKLNKVHIEMELQEELRTTEFKLNWDDEAEVDNTTYHDVIKRLDTLSTEEMHALLDMMKKK